MSDQGFSSPGLEGMAIKRKSLALKIVLYGSTTEGSITAAVTNCGDNTARVWLSSQSATAPSEANFSGLTSASAPTVIGVFVDVGDARRVHGITVPVNSIKSPTMTAGVVTNKGAVSAIYASGNSGVTSGKDIAFQVSCTTLDLDAAAINHEFSVELTYDCE